MQKCARVLVYAGFLNQAWYEVPIMRWFESSTAAGNIAVQKGGKSMRRAARCRSRECAVRGSRQVLSKAVSMVLGWLTEK